jgi:hypothetical protein
MSAGKRAACALSFVVGAALAACEERVPPKVLEPSGAPSSAPPIRVHPARDVLDASPSDAGHEGDGGHACLGRAECHGGLCCVSLGGERFCADTCPGAAVAIACETMSDCPSDGQLGMMSEHRRFVSCERGVCDGPRVRDADPPCAPCLAEDCESEIGACDDDPSCKAARASLMACLRKMTGNEAARTGCWDNFQVRGGLRAEPSLRTCATVRCPRCEGPDPSRKLPSTRH